MTVSTVVDHNDYTGNGLTTSFPYKFRVFDKSNLTVTVVDMEENITELVLDTDYTVTGAGGYSGGNVVLTSPLANGWKISISREMAPTQETDLRNQGKFFAEVHEDAFDKLTMLIQQGYSTFKLALRKPSSIANWYDALGNYIRNLRDPRDPQDAVTKKYADNLVSSAFNKTLRTPENIPQLPGVEQRKNKIVAMDNSGNPIMVLPESGSAADVLIELAKPTGANNIGTNNGDNVQSVLNEMRTNEYEAKSYFGGQLATLKADLSNPLVQQVNLTLIGDSITWGMTASGIAATDPRSHQLTDARNNGSSNTWANLLHKWIAKEYFDGQAATESTINNPASGVNVFTYGKNIDLFPGQQSINLIGSWVTNVNPAALKGVYIDSVFPHTGKEINFSITGDSFILVFAAIPGGATYQVYVDGVSLGTFQTDSTSMGVPVSFGNVREHQLGPFTGPRSIRVISNGEAGSTFRVEGIRIKKSFQMINQGIIGVATAEYTNNLLTDAVLGRSRHVIVQLGTNDRGLDYASNNAANTPLRLKTALEGLVTALGNRNITLMCANDVTQDESTFSYSMKDVRDSIYSVAYQHSLDFIDNYIPSRTLIDRNYSFVADGLHPNDFGHATIAGNIISALSNATNHQYSIKESVTSIAVSVSSGWNAINTINFNFPTTPKSILSYSLRVKLSTENDFGAWSSSQEVVTDDSGTVGGVQNPSGTIVVGFVRTFLSAGGATRALVKSSEASPVTINIEARAYWI